MNMTSVMYPRQAFRVTRGTLDTHRIELPERLPLGWASHLSLGLSRAGVSILSGRARRVTKSAWNGELTVKSENSRTRLEELDLMDMIVAGERICAGSQFMPKLVRYELRDCYRKNGTLFVRVEGRDQIGFLAGLLMRFASCTLFPTELVIRTASGVVSDEFHLIGAAGIEPTEGIRLALERELNTMAAA